MAAIVTKVYGLAISIEPKKVLIGGVRYSVIMLNPHNYNPPYLMKHQKNGKNKLLRITKMVMKAKHLLLINLW